MTGAARPPRLFAALAAVSRGVSNDLLSDATREAWSRLPPDLDASFRWGMIECHMDERASSDLVVEVDRPPPIPALSSVHVELDATDGGWGERVTFGGFEPEPGHPPRPGWAEALLGVLSRAGHDRVPSTLARVLDGRSKDVWLAHAASLRPRGVDRVRLVLSVPVRGVARELARVQWAGDVGWVGEIAAEVCVGLARTQVHLDAGAQLGPKVGVEAFFPGRPGEDSRWGPTLAILEKLAPRKAAALRSWPGQDQDFVRQLGVKVVLSTDGQTSAKAYLAFCNRGPGVISSHHRDGSVTPAESMSWNASACSASAPRS